MIRQYLKKINLLAIMLFAFVLIIFSSSAEAMGVRPLIIDLEMVPGESRDFEITLTPSEDDEVVNLTYYQPVQMNTGGLSYQEADSESFPVIEWIQLEQNRVELPDDENRQVKGTVTVPFGADTSHTVIIMVEPEVEEASQGVTFKVRYAIRLNINIQSPGMRPRGELNSFEFLTETGENPVINTVFHNNSKMYYEASAEATIRNEQGRLVERVVLKTPVAWQSGRDTTTIYPGSEVLYTGTVTEPLYPGKYQLRLFYRYADSMQIIERKEIKVESTIGSEQELRPIRLNPESINLNLRPGGTNSQVIEIENNSDEKTNLIVSGRDIVSDYPHSIYKNLEVQLRGQQDIEILPNGRKRVVLTIKAPKDIVAGGYYGYIDFTHQISEEEKEVYTTAVEVVLGEDELVDKAELLSFYYDGQGDEGLFSLEILNKGDIHFIPEGRVTIKDDTGSIIQTMDLALQEGISKILPKQSKLIIAIGSKLNPGDYIAEVSISKEGQAIVSKEFEFNVE